MNNTNIFRYANLFLEKMYYYIIELVDTSVGKLMENVLDKIHSLLYFRFRKEIRQLVSFDVMDTSKSKEIREKVEELAATVLNVLQQDNRFKLYVIKVDQQKHLPEDWVFMLIKEIIFKMGTDRTDLHYGNLGINNQGYFRYFDPAYGGL